MLRTTFLCFKNINVKENIRNKSQLDSPDVREWFPCKEKTTLLIDN